ncbi:MAG: hypothetical protein JO142_07465 [Burkholderiales bacterium]|nr:hypothetical protein [Burkholderiales bacterium]
MKIYVFWGVNPASYLHLIRRRPVRAGSSFTYPSRWERGSVLKLRNFAARANAGIDFFAQMTSRGGEKQTVLHRAGVNA